MAKTSGPMPNIYFGHQYVLSFVRVLSLATPETPFGFKYESNFEALYESRMLLINIYQGVYKGGIFI